MNGSADEIIEAREDTVAGGFRFGLRGLIASTAIVGGVLALVQWLGILAGIACAAGIAVIALSFLVIAAMTYRLVGGQKVARGSFLARCERLTPGLIIWTAILINGVVFAGGAQGLTLILGRRALHTAWHNELGFQHRRTLVYEGDNVRQYVEVTAITPGSFCEGAGLRPGDVIAVNEDRFFRSLENRRGEDWTFEVGSGSTTGVWDDYQKRQATLPIPTGQP